LRAYQRLLPEFRAAGAQLAGVSPDLPDDSLTTREKQELQFEVLSDPGNAVARAFGLVFRFSDDLRATYESFGRLLDHSDWELPMPATYVIDRAGVIRFAHIDPEYTRRAEPADVLAAVRGLA
jgi:peroxiredoxin